ncbi:MAG: branched-chain amino acid aminotransferase [Clostridia bacterium]|nr:branched-chain amino acid aminotransferase [Clostridia bacterium]
MKITLTNSPKQKPTGTLGFCRYYTDHMFTMEYDTEHGWHNDQIVPYGNLSLSPATTALHYGQTVFEGLKAFRNKDGEVNIFRPYDNFKRLNDSCDRICIPRFDIDKVMEGLKTLLKIEESWIPTEKGTSLYIRPAIIGVDPFLGVKASDTYLFFIILSPSGSYYAHGLKPVSIYVEDFFSRSAHIGGTGAAKFGGNYGASLKASYDAKKKGYDQVLWLDSNEHKYIEEVGAMNMFFVIDNVVITPSLNGSILPGITRNSLINLSKKLGYKVEERNVSIDEVLQAAKEGRLNEAFGSGTAAVVSPVGKITFKDETYILNNGEIGKISQQLYNELTGIQNGNLPDENGWIVGIK